MRTRRRCWPWRLHWNSAPATRWRMPSAKAGTPPKNSRHTRAWAWKAGWPAATCAWAGPTSPPVAMTTAPSGWATAARPWPASRWPTRCGRLGLRPLLLSGDAAAPVAEVAAAVGIDDYAHRLSPEGKLARVRALQQAGHRVLMLGDGINDARVLAGADVSVAMAGGAPLAHRAADLVLTGSRLGRVPQMLELARRSRRIIRQNLAWAMAYNLLALPFAAIGWVKPGLDELCMAAYSLPVTGTAMQ